MLREYKVQKGESLQDVVIKLYGSLEYQTKFLADNNLLNIDITQSQLYQNDDKIICQLRFYISYPSNPIPYQNIVFTKYNNEYISNQTSIVVNETTYVIPSFILKQYNSDTLKNDWTIYNINALSVVESTSNSNNLIPFFDSWTFQGTYEIKKTKPYFEPFTVVYDDSIIKSVVPAITPSQMETESNLKKYKPFSQQSFFDVSLITTGGLNNVIALAYQNNIDINTFDSAQTPSISYYIDEIENRINYNFMQTLTVKPATAIQLETFVPPTPGTHIAFNESFSNSFN